MNKQLCIDIGEDYCIMKRRDRLQESNKKVKIEATNTFIEKCANIDKMAKKLQAAISMHFGRVSDDIGWGDVGDIAHVEEMLAEVITFIEGK